MGLLTSLLFFWATPKRAGREGDWKKEKHSEYPEECLHLTFLANDYDYFEEFWLILWQEDSFENWLSLASFSFILF